MFPSLSLNRAMFGPQMSFASSSRYSLAMWALMDECMPAERHSFSVFRATTVVQALGDQH